MRESRKIARAATVASVVVAVALVAAVFFEAGSAYRVTARFQNASALVKGNEVQVSGLRVGSVQGIDLSPDGQAEVTLEIDDSDYAPLRRGTEPIIRQTGLAGVANRYVELRLPPPGAPAIPDGGSIDVSDTVSAVELDQLFNTFEPRTRRALSGVIRGAARGVQGRSDEARLGMLYLNPALAASTRLLSELNGEDGSFDRFLVANARLANDVAARREELAGLIDGFATAASAIAARKTELSQAIAQLPPVMRRSNTTFVNLRATLDDLDPLVADARPVARELQPLLGDLRRLAGVGRPAFADLARLARRRGRDNDLLEVARLLPRFRDAAVRPVEANGAQRAAAFTSLTDSLRGLTPIAAFGRPYSVDATGWFDDFAHSGYYDALGGVGRTASNFNAFAQTAAGLTFVPPELRNDLFERQASIGQRNRCPGSMERGTVWKPSPDFNCDESQVPPGP